MLAVSHQPTMYVANTQPYYYVQAQQTVPAGQWTTAGQVVHSGSGYVYSTYPSTSYPVTYQTTQQVARPQTFAVAAPQQQMKPAPQPMMAYAQPQMIQRSYSSSSGGQIIPTQNSMPVMDANDFTPASPVLSEVTTASDDSTGSSSSSSSSRYNLPSSAINHYTAPQRDRRRSFHQPRHPQAYGVPVAGQSALSLPPPQVSQQPMYAPNASGQPMFVRNTGRSDHPVQYQPSQGQQIYSSFELYKPANAPHNQRPALVRRSSSTAMAGPRLTSGSYGQGLGMGGGAGSSFGMAYGGGGNERSGKWWKLGR